MGATILEVARRAGVSSATVSRVMNQSNLVLPQTRDRVLAVVKELNYVPDQRSRNVRKSESRMLLVMIPELNNPFYGEIMSGMTDAANKAGYNLLITPTHSDPSREREILTMLKQKQADGVAFMAPTLSEREMLALSAQYPLVQCCEYYEKADIPYVSVDNYTAWMQATLHLIRLGHRRIAMSSSDNRFVSTKLRERAYMDALKQSGIPFDEELLRRGNYSFESGYENAQVFLKLKDRPTAIMGISDTVAAGLIGALAGAGLNVPRDVAVIGFDGLDIAKMIRPALSTVIQPRYRLGFMSIQVLLEKLSNRSAQSQQLFLPHEIVIRQSTM